MTAGQRADLALVARGLAPSRARAQAMIAAGKVLAAGQPVTRAAQTVGDGDSLTLAEPDHPYVSRGALKLAAALPAFGIDPSGLDCLDIGASTGGFTDVLLRAGAKRVVAVDVGHDQMHDTLRADPRVMVREGLNARDLSAGDLPDGFDGADLIVCDASFISLRLVLPPAMVLARPAARLVALVKPQFEAGRQRLGKGGVVRDTAVRAAVLQETVDWFGEQAGWRVTGTMESPVPGPKGNIEYLMAGVRT